MDFPLLHHTKVGLSNYEPEQIFNLQSSAPAIAKYLIEQNLPPFNVVDFSHQFCLNRWNVLDFSIDALLDDIDGELLQKVNYQKMKPIANLLKQELYRSYSALAHLNYGMHLRQFESSEFLTTLSKHLKELMQNAKIWNIISTEFDAMPKATFNFSPDERKTILLALFYKQFSTNTHLFLDSPLASWAHLLMHYRALIQLNNTIVNSGNSSGVQGGIVLPQEFDAVKYGQYTTLVNLWLPQTSQEALANNLNNTKWPQIFEKIYYSDKKGQFDADFFNLQLASSQQFLTSNLLQELPITETKLPLGFNGAKIGPLRLEQILRENLSPNVSFKSALTKYSDSAYHFVITRQR